MENKTGTSLQVLVFEQLGTIWRVLWAWESIEPVSPVLANILGSPQREKLSAEMPNSPSPGQMDDGKNLQTDADVSIYWAVTNYPSDTTNLYYYQFLQCAE